VPGTTATTKLAYFTAGALIAGVIVSALLRIQGSGDDEERPPIIVRGGSLIFQSGDAGTLGKSWMPVGSDWQPDHLKGVPVSMFTVKIQGGGGIATCPSMERTREIAVTYTEGGQSSVFRLQIKPRPHGSGKPAPAIVGSGLRGEPATTGNPQIVFGEHGKGEITRVQYNALGSTGTVDCHGPITSLLVWQGN